MNVLVAPGETNAIANRERRRRKFRVVQNRRKVARPAALKPDVIGCALIFDAGDGCAEARKIGKFGNKFHAVGAHRDHAGRGFDHIMAAQKPGDEFGRRLLEDLKRGAGLLYLSLVHHHDQVGEREGFVLTMRDMDEGNAETPLQPPQLGAHAHTQERVKRRQGLVQQKDLWMGDERTRQRDPLLLAARELSGNALGERRHGDEFEKLHRLSAPLRLFDAAHLLREGDVVDAIEMREQRIALKHHRRTALGGRQIGDIGAADQNVAFADPLVAGDHPQRRGLAASRRAEQAAIGVGRHFQIDGLDGERRAVALADVDEFEIGGLGHGAHATR